MLSKLDYQFADLRHVVRGHPRVQLLEAEQQARTFRDTQRAAMNVIRAWNRFFVEHPDDASEAFRELRDAVTALQRIAL